MRTSIVQRGLFKIKNEETAFSDQVLLNKTPFEVMNCAGPKKHFWKCSTCVKMPQLCSIGICIQCKIGPAKKTHQTGKPANLLLYTTTVLMWKEKETQMYNSMWRIPRNDPLAGKTFTDARPLELGDPLFLANVHTSGTPILGCLTGTPAES